jgi:hypothetical protein
MAPPMVDLFHSLGGLRNTKRGSAQRLKRSKYLGTCQHTARSRSCGGHLVSSIPLFACCVYVEFGCGVRGSAHAMVGGGVKS